MIRAEELETQRHIVRKSKFGTKEYDKEFDILHKMCMEYMAELYKRVHGRSSKANFKTPYDDDEYGLGPDEYHRGN